MKKTTLYLTLVFLFFGCSRDFQSCNRDIQVGERNYHIEQYSGGKLIKEYNFKGIINNQENSDGYYWYKNDTLIEVSGDVYLQSWK